MVHAYRDTLVTPTHDFEFWLMNSVVRVVMTVGECVKEMTFGRVNMRKEYQYVKTEDRQQYSFSFDGMIKIRHKIQPETNERTTPTDTDNPHFKIFMN